MTRALLLLLLFSCHHTHQKKTKKKLVHAASGTLLEADVLVAGVDADAKPEDQIEREGEEAEDHGASSNDE